MHPGMKKKAFILFFFCMCFSRLMAQYGYLLHKTHGQRYPYLYAVYSRKVDNPDSVSAFSEINAIAKTAVQNGDDDLLLETKAMKVYYYYYQNVYGHYPSKLVEPKISALLQEAKQKRAIWLEAQMESSFVAQYNHLKQSEKAFEHAHRMYVILNKESFDECPEKKAYLCTFANQLYLFRDYGLALQYLAVASKDSVQKPWDQFFIQCPNTMGLCYRALGKLDSSNYYFTIAKRKAVSTGNIVWEGLCDGNIGENYFLQKNYEKAKPLLQINADISAEHQDWGPAANALTILGDISLRQKDIKTAEQQLVQARTYVHLSNQDRRLAKLYPLLSRFYILTGNRAMAAAYLDSSFTARDSIDLKFNTLFMNMAQAVQKVELEKEDFAIVQLKNEQKIRTLERNILVVIFVLGLSVVFFIYDKQKRRYREKNEELERAARDLDNFTKSLAEKNNLIEALQQQVGSPDLEVLRQLQESIILTEDQWIDFKKLFNKVHAGYLQRLQVKLPSLTPAETRFAVLSKLRLSGHEMASMLGVGADAVRKYRSRLRKKLDLPEEESLDELIANI